jgi:hypothetical protein
LKKTSNTLIINLKRFDYDYNLDRRIKLNDYCEFPMKLNIFPWTEEGINLKEKNEQEGEGDEEIVEEIDQEQFIYEL